MSPQSTALHGLQRRRQIVRIAGGQARVHPDGRI